MTGWGPVNYGALLGFLWYSGRKGGLRVPPITEVIPVDDGATLDLPGSPRIIHTPGHTPGSVAVHVPAVDAVFVGDSFTTRNVLTGEERVAVAPFTLDPEGAKASWGRLDGIDARWLLVGHGDPWDKGVAAAVREARAH
jgi:glyoxylase-like metal-dependent hydrolase (beta-lactamase superfamily II)